MLYFYFMFLYFCIKIFYFIQGFYFVCKACSTHLNKIFRVEEAERDKSLTTLAFPWLKQSVIAVNTRRSFPPIFALRLLCLSVIPYVCLKCLNKTHWQPSAIDFIFIALH